MTTTQHEPSSPVATPPFKGQAAVVTGATSGIGRAIARVLAARGAHVIVSGQDEARGSSVVKEIRADGGQADFVSANLALDANAVRGFAARAAAAAGGRVDILVNNAGIYPATATAHLPDGDLDAMLAVNIRAPHVRSLRWLRRWRTGAAANSGVHRPGGSSCTQHNNGLTSKPAAADIFTESLQLWTPQHPALQRYKVTHDGTEQRRPA
jgi:NAD(P)-dependent dehydrogenase (short-subunit alcohol dehydrogenase family)